MTDHRTTTKKIKDVNSLNNTVYSTMQFMYNVSSITFTSHNKYTIIILLKQTRII